MFLARLNSKTVKYSSYFFLPKFAKSILYCIFL